MNNTLAGMNYINYLLNFFLRRIERGRTIASLRPTNQYRSVDLFDMAFWRVRIPIESTRREERAGLSKVSSG